MKSKSFLIILCILGIFHLLTFRIYPIASVDESWLSSHAIAMVDKNVQSVDAPFFTKNTGDSYLGTLILGVYYKIFGLGFVQGRLFILSLSFLLLAVFYQFSRKFFGNKISIWALVYFASTYIFFYSSHLLRFDIPVITAILLSLWLFLTYLKTRDAKYCFLTGLIAGFSSEFQINAFIFIISIVISWYFLERSFKFLKELGFRYFLLGIVFFIVYYLIVHVLPDINLYLEQKKYYLLIDHPLPVLSLPLREIISAEFLRYQYYFKTSSRVEFFIIILSIIYALKAHDFYLKFIAKFIIISALLFFLVSSNKDSFYFIYLFPFVSIIVASVFIKILKELRKPISLFFSIFIILILFNYYNQFNLYFKNRNYDYLKIYFMVSPHLKNDSVVFGIVHHYLPLKDYKFKNSTVLTWYRIFNNFTLTESLNIIKPDFIILDKFLEGLMVDDESKIRNKGFARGLHNISKREFNDYLTRHATLVTTYASPYYGEVKLFKIDR